MKPVMKIDIVSDVVCPWCYIGKRRLEKVIEELSPSFNFQVRYHPFELNPDTPENGVDQKEHLAKKFGGETKYREITNHTTQVAASEGLHFDFSKQSVLPNTRVIHAIINAAQDHGKQNSVVDAFFSAYFSEGTDLSKKENLLSVAEGAGFPTEELKKVLEDGAALTNVIIAENESRKLGINAVPFYIINDQYGISGAQSHETFINAFREIAAKEVQNETA